MVPPLAAAVPWHIEHRRANSASLRRELAAFEFTEWSDCAPFHAVRAPASTGPTLLMTRSEGGDRSLALALNPGPQAVRFPLPRAGGGGAWHLAFDSFIERPESALRTASRPQFAAETSELAVQARSLRILVTSADPAK